MYPWTGTYTKGPVYREIVLQKGEPLEGEWVFFQPHVSEMRCEMR